MSWTCLAVGRAIAPAYQHLEIAGEDRLVREPTGGGCEALGRFREGSETANEARDMMSVSLSQALASLG